MRQKLLRSWCSAIWSNSYNGFPDPPRTVLGDSSPQPVLMSATMDLYGLSKSIIKIRPDNPYQTQPWVSPFLADSIKFLFLHSSKFPLLEIVLIFHHAASCLVTSSFDQSDHRQATIPVDKQSVNKAIEMRINHKRYCKKPHMLIWILNLMNIVEWWNW